MDVDQCRVGDLILRDMGLFNVEALRRIGRSKAFWIRRMVTNVDSKLLDARRISDMYGLRWSVEIQFRTFKQSCQLSRGLRHKSGFHHIEAMVLAEMLYQLLTLKVHATLSRKPQFRGWLSIDKTCDAISIHLIRLTREPVTWRFDPDPRHLRFELRRRVNHWQSAVQCLD